MSNEYRDLTEDEILACVTPEMVGWSCLGDIACIIGDDDRIRVHWEHEGWWVTNLDTGAEWAVSLCSGPESITFEQVSEGVDE